MMKTAFAKSILIKIILLTIQFELPDAVTAQERLKKETAAPLSIEQLLDIADAEYDRNKAEKLQKTVKEKTNSKSHRFHYLMARTYEIISKATDTIKNERVREDEIYAVKALDHIYKALEYNKNHSDSHRIYSEMLARRVYGPPTGVKYDATTLEELDKALELDPDNFRARLRQAVNYLERPLDHGGDREAGLRLLEKLHKEKPENSRVLYYISYYYKIKNNAAQQREYLKKARKINPRELKAEWELKEVDIQDRELTIKKISIRNKTETSPNLIKKRLAPFLGKTYTQKTKEALTAHLTEIQTIDDVTYFYTVDETGLAIDCAFNEDNLIVVNAMLGFFISLDHKRKTNWFDGEAPSSLFATIYYETNNFLGSSNFFSIASMVVYNDILYQHYFPWIDLRLGLEFNALPMEKFWYHKGRLVSPEPYEYIDFMGRVGIGKSFDFFFDIFLMQEIKKEFYTDIHSYFKIPAEDITSSTYIEAHFEYIAHHENVWVMDGYMLELIPEIITKPGYENWGYDINRFTHDRRAMFKFFSHLGIYKRILKQIQFREDIFYLYASNPYRLELFPVGKDAAADPYSMKLRGFYQEEFLSSHVFVTNTYISFPIIPKQLRVGFFYDNAIFLDKTTKSNISYKHGVGGQLMVKFPRELEFTFQCAFGLNADRDRLPGIEIDFYFSRLFVL